MGLLLKQIFAFLKLLNSETGTNQISTGVAVGFILGMTPVFSLQTLVAFALLFFFRIQIGAAFVTAFFFKFIAYLLDPVFHQVGSAVLEIPSLRPLFIQLYNMPIIPFTRFNNSIVMGSGVISILLFPFVFLAARMAVVKYREKVVARFQDSRAWKAIKATSLYQWYYKYDQLHVGE